ncbi:MAG TPA: FtsX-like permease family protein, partial [Pirellulales bacterium]|nr:FtsX-like permease family protein [Pirellulales bacterium]
LAGRADLEVVAAGNGAFPQSMVAEVERIPGIAVVAPVVQRPTILYFNGHRAKVLALAIDPSTDEKIRDYRLESGKFFDGDNGVLLDSNFARSLGAQIGDEAKILTRRGMQHLRVVGILAPSGVAGFTRGSTLFLPLAFAQRVFAAPAQVDSLQIVAASGTSVDALEQRIAAKLPPNLTVRPPASRTQLADETLHNAEDGLRLAGALSLVLAVFIILNTFLMSVTERRNQLAILRAIGATGRQVMQMLLLEGLVLGAVGSILGIFAGIAGAYLLTRAIEQLVQTSLPAMHISIPTLLISAALGIGLSLTAAYIPALRARSVSPLEGMGAGPQEDLSRLPWKLGAMGGVFVLIGGVLLTASMNLWLPIEVATPAGAVILVGFVLMVPSGLRPMSRIAAWLPARWIPAESDLARGQLLTHPVRAMLTVGVLFVALATGIALGTSILNTTRDVNQWLERTIVADFFVRAMMPDMSTGMAADIPADVGDQLRKIHGIEHISTIRFVSTRVNDQGVVLVAKDFPSDEPLPLDLREGSEPEVRRGLAQGDVVLGTKIAERLHVGLGDSIKLQANQGLETFRVAGVTNEYTVGGLAIFMQRDTAERRLGVTGVDAYLIKAQPEAMQSVESELRQVADEHGLLLQSAASLRKLVDTMMAGVVGCLWVLLSLALMVAAFGIVNTLAMNVMEQTRELAILRVVAMTRRQIRRTILCQASILGLIGLVPGMVIGAGMAWLMHVGTMRETGHLIAYSAHPMFVLGLLAIAYLVVIAAATLPARRAARLELLTALHYE